MNCNAVMILPEMKKEKIMKRAMIFSLGVLIAFAANAAAQSKSAKLEKEFIERHRAEEAAEIKRDIAALDRMFTDDFIWIAASGAVSDKKKFLDDVKADTEPAAPQKLDYENFKVRAYGNTAMVNYILVVSGKDKDNKDYTSRYQMSVLWFKQKKTWTISNFHATRVRA